jgi:hypothetical protein
MAVNGRELLKDKRFLILSGIVLVLAVLVTWQLVSKDKDAPPPLAPDVLTRDRLQRLTSAVSAFVANEQRLPNSIEEGARTESTKDGWNRPFTFAPGTDGPKKVSFVIRSSGADGVPDNDDDQTSTVRFGNDGYGHLGVHSGEMVPPTVGG